jgi:hypothetical protein
VRHSTCIIIIAAEAAAHFIFAVCGAILLARLRQADVTE